VASRPLVVDCCAIYCRRLTNERQTTQRHLISLRRFRLPQMVCGSARAASLTRAIPLRMHSLDVCSPEAAQILRHRGVGRLQPARRLGPRRGAKEPKILSAVSADRHDRIWQRHESLRLLTAAGEVPSACVCSPMVGNNGMKDARPPLTHRDSPVTSLCATEWCSPWT